MNTGRLAALRHYRGPRAAILKTSLIENRRGQRAKWAWHHFPPRLIVSTIQCVENNSLLDPRVHQNASQSTYISKNFLGGGGGMPPDPPTLSHLRGKIGLRPTLEHFFSNSKIRH